MGKLLGAILIMLAATVAGWHRARHFAERPRQIREMILGLQRLVTEISYGLTPLPEALKKAALPMSKPLREIFEQAAGAMQPASGLTARDSLHQAIHKSWGSTSMKNPERDTMLQLAYSLGLSDREDQLRHITLAVQQLKHEEATAQSEQMKYEKLSRNMGLLIGALIVILMY